MGYTQSESKSVGVGSETDSVSTAAYALWAPAPGWEIEGLAGVNWSESETKGLLNTGLGPNLTAGHSGGLGFNLAANAGYRFRSATALGEAYAKPFVAAGYSSQERGSFVEVGALGAGLAFPSKTFERASVAVGLATGIDLQSGTGWTIRPELRVAWSHYLIDPSPAVQAFLGGVPLVLRDPDPGRDAAIVAVELTAWQTRNVEVFGGYSGEFRDNARAHQGRLGVRVIW